MEIGNLIPTVILTLPFVFVLIMAWIKSNEKHRSNQLKAELYMKAMEKGETLPENLFKEPVKRNKSLKTGIILISAGIGIILFMALNADPGNYVRRISAGLIPFCLGIGYLLIHFIWKKQRIEDEE